MTGTADLIKRLREAHAMTYPGRSHDLSVYSDAASALAEAADALEAAERERDGLRQTIAELYIARDQARAAAEAAAQALQAAEELYQVGLLAERNGLYERVHKLRRDWLTAHATGQRQPAKHEAVRAIEFAITLEDKFEQHEFLHDWLHGDTASWPAFAATGQRQGGDDGK